MDEITVTLTVREAQAIIDLVNWEWGYWGDVPEEEKSLLSKIEPLMPKVINVT